MDREVGLLRATKLACWYANADDDDRAEQGNAFSQSTHDPVGISPLTSVRTLVLQLQQKVGVESPTVRCCPDL